MGADLVENMNSAKTVTAPLWRRAVPRLVTLVIVVAIIQPRWVAESRDLATGGHLRLAVLNPVDVLLVPFVFVIGLAVRRTVRARTGSMPLWIGTLLLVGGLMALAAAPSFRGGLIVSRLMAGLGLIWVLAQFSKEEFTKNLALPVMIVAGLEGLLAISQLMTGRAVLPEWLGAAAPITVDGVERAAGTFGHAYELATLGLIAVAFGIAAHRTVPLRRRRLWLVPIAVAAVPVAISFSRSALIGGVVIVSALLWGMRSETTAWSTVLVPVAVGLIVPAALFAGSWGSRVGHSVGGAEESGLNLRVEQLEQARDMIETDWLIGVGPGLYAVALEDRAELDPSRAYPVYDAPLYITAEDGVVVGGLLILMTAALARQSLRRSTENRVLFLAPMPILIFDHLLYTSPIGLIMLSLWLGGLAALESRPEL
jgi:hypothetical protein